MTAQPLLQVDRLVVQYGPAVAVDGVSLELHAGERVALVGPNGAGKSCLINAVCGLVRPAAGRVLVDGEDVTGHRPGDIVRRGVTQVPEGRQVFPTLPVEANLLLGAYGREFRREIVTATLRFMRKRGEIAERLERVYELMPKLRELRERPAGQTSGGEQQMVAVGRALMAEPRLLAVDELSLGLAPLVVQSLAEFLIRLNEEHGVALLLVEQNALLAFELCTRAYVVEAGRLALSGTSAELQADEAVRHAYLGGGLEVALTEFLQLVVIGLSTGSAFALVGIGMVLIFQTTSIVNFAQGAFAVLGGLFMVGLADDLPRIVAGALTVLLVGLIGSATGFVAVGFRNRTTPLASLIITLGLGLLISSLNLLAFGDRPHTYPAIFDRAWDVGGVSVQPQYVIVFTVTLVAAALLTAGLQRTIAGQALVACADSRRAAELVGINVRAVAAIAFAVSAGLSALGWVLLTPVDPISYESDVRIAINGFAAAAFGGLVSIRLALVGGLSLGIAEQLVVGYADEIPYLGQQARQYELAAALLIMLVLIGWRSRHEAAE